MILVTPELTGSHESGSLLVCAHFFIKAVTVTLPPRWKRHILLWWGRCSTKGSAGFASCSESFTKRLTFVQYLRTKNSLLLQCVHWVCIHCYVTGGKTEVRKGQESLEDLLKYENWKKGIETYIMYLQYKQVRYIKIITIFFFQAQFQ